MKTFPTEQVRLDQIEIDLIDMLALLARLDIEDENGDDADISCSLLYVAQEIFEDTGDHDYDVFCAAREVADVYMREVVNVGLTQPSSKAL